MAYKDEKRRPVTDALQNRKDSRMFITSIPETRYHCKGKNLPMHDEPEQGE
jgi:hypothetical protein